ncbi:hypothetical protein GCM10028856_15140 [Halopiger thermotolerans]
MPSRTDAGDGSERRQDEEVVGWIVQIGNECNEDEDGDHHSDRAETPTGDAIEEFGPNIGLWQTIADIEERDSSPADQDRNDQFLLEWGRSRETHKRPQNTQYDIHAPEAQDGAPPADIRTNASHGLHRSSEIAPVSYGC